MASEGAYVADVLANALTSKISLSSVNVVRANAVPVQVANRLDGKYRAIDRHFVALHHFLDLRANLWEEKRVRASVCMRVGVYV
jgi:hypothetical protein